MSTQVAMTQFVSGLKSKSDDTRIRTANELHHFVNTELREMPVEEHTHFMDQFNHYIFEMVSSSDLSERKGGILAIVSLIGVDVGNTTTRISRFANCLRNLLPSNDVVVMEMAAKAMGILALSSGTFSAEYVEFEVQRALEWLSGDRNEGKRHAAVLCFKELAVNTPTFFFQKIQQFFDCIFTAVRDPKPLIREGAVAALRAALTVTSQREGKASLTSQWYKQCYDAAQTVYDESILREKKLSKDDWAHGSLMIINELLRCSNVEGERLRMEMEEITAQQYLHEKAMKEFACGNKQQGSLNALQQFQQKASPLSNFGLPTRQVQRKPTLFESRFCKELITSNFDTVCNLAMRHRNSRSVYVQQTMLIVLPRLSAFSPERYCRVYLEETVNFLLTTLKAQREKTTGFQAIGLLAISVQENIFRYMGRIMEMVSTLLPTQELQAKKHKNFIVDPTVFTCISMLAKAIGPGLKKDVHDLLDSMLATGLSPALTASLKDIAVEIPQLKKEIQDGLLKTLSIMLMGHPLKHPGAPKATSVTMTTSASSGTVSESQDVTSITLALKTLGSFDFEGHSLTPFVRYCAEHYLSSDHKEIRTEGVKTCARLLTPLLNLLSSNQGQVSMAAMDTVAEVLNKLLVVGITDVDPDIRLCVLGSLDERFDDHLAQAENLSALFVALNDEVYEIREIAICMIGRLSSKNPAYVMPSLRKTLIQILTELEHSGVGRNKEQAARMLGHLVANAARLIRPYMDPILKEQEVEVLSIIVWSVGGVLLIALLILLGRIILAKKKYPFDNLEILNQPCQLNGNVFRIRIDSPAYSPSSTSLSRDTVDLVPGSDATIIDSPTSRRSEIGYQMDETSHNLCHNTPQSRTNQAYLSDSNSIHTLTTYRDLPAHNLTSNSDLDTSVPCDTYQTNAPRDTHQQNAPRDTHQTSVTRDANHIIPRVLHQSVIRTPTSVNPTQSRVVRSDYSGACAVINGYVISPPPYREVVNSCNRLPSIVVARQNLSPRRHLQFSL